MGTLDELQAVLAQLQISIGAKAAQEEYAAFKAAAAAAETVLAAGGLTDTAAALLGIGLLEKALRLTVTLAQQADAKALRATRAAARLEDELAAAKGRGTKELIQQLENDPNPAGQIVADLFRGGAVRGG